uniref:Hexosyltransferase n=1 Tax=Meloidogyne hapla TaxID=6305 RepID=A0A1I8B664_MELHA
MGIRKSWAKDAHKGIIIRFVIGGPTLKEKNSTILENELKQEQNIFGDLIRYNIEDGYNNLHFKMGAAFQWQQKFCSNSEFVMKTDDDTIVDLPRWEFWIEKKFKKDLENGPAFFGVVYAENKPIRDPKNKWYVPYEYFPGKQFPRYLQGASYFGSGEAIKLIMAHTKEVIGYNMDDIIFTGTLADIANVSRIDYGHTHFRGGYNLQDEEKCEQGQPLVFSIFRNLINPDEYIEVYEDLHNNLECKKT